MPPKKIGRATKRKRQQNSETDNHEDTTNEATSTTNVEETSRARKRAACKAVTNKRNNPSKSIFDNNSSSEDNSADPDDEEESDSDSRESIHNPLSREPPFGSSESAGQRILANTSSSEDNSADSDDEKESDSDSSESIHNPSSLEPPFGSESEDDDGEDESDSSESEFLEDPYIANHSVQFLTKDFNAVGWGSFAFNNWNIPTRCTAIRVQDPVNPNDHKFRRLLNVLLHDKRRWISINLKDISPSFQSSPAFLSLLVATFGKTDMLELPIFSGLAAFSCLNAGLIMPDGLKGLKFYEQSRTPVEQSFTVEQMTMFSMGLSSASRLKSLSFQSVPSISSDVARALGVGLERNSTLEQIELELVDSEIDPDGLSSVIDSLSKCQTLRSLKLDCNYVGPVFDSIKRWLSRDDCKLEELHLNYCLLFPSLECTLVDLEQPNDSLTILELNNMNVDSSCLQGILSNFRNLRTLDLSHNEISDLQPLLLENGLLDETSRLERLVLDYNPISISHGNEFAKRLPAMKVLRSLELAGVPFLKDDDDAELFLKHVSMNTSLENIYITLRNASPEMAQHTLYLNRAGRRHLGHDPGDLQLNLLPLVIERARRIHYYDSEDRWNVPSLELDGLDATFWLLRENSPFQSRCGSG